MKKRILIAAGILVVIVASLCAYVILKYDIQKIGKGGIVGDDISNMCISTSPACGKCVGEEHFGYCFLERGKYYAN